MSSSPAASLIDLENGLRDTASAVLTTDTIPQSFYARTARAMTQGLSRVGAYQRLLRTQTARQIITQGLYGLLFESAATTAQIQPYLRGQAAGQGMRQRLFRMASSGDYYNNAGGQAAPYTQAVSNNLLAGAAIPTRLSRLPVSTRAQRQQFLQRLMNTPTFRQTWTDQLATVASNYGTFTAAQIKSAARAFGQDFGFERTLARLLSDPVAQRDISIRANPPQPTAGPAFDDPWATNPQWLFPEPSSNGQPLVPMDSPWGQRVGFPGVSYDAIIQSTASDLPAVPTLSLPTALISAARLANGNSVSMWVQAKGPGELLSAQYANGTSGTIDVPLITVNAQGQVVAGLYGPGSIDATPNQTIFGYTDPYGDQLIGSPLAITSQATVIDDTWHQVTFVANQTRQALYVDGLLQGTDTAAYQQYDSGLTTINNANQVTVALNGTPEPGSVIKGQVDQNTGLTTTFTAVVPVSGSASLQVNAASGDTALTTGTYTNVSSGTISGTTVTLDMENAVTSTAPLSVELNYQTAGASLSFTPTSSQVTIGRLLGVSSGGTIFPESTANPAPQTNYPQSFIGAMDELGVWTTDLTQPQVQAIVTAPISQAASIPAPLYYFDFNQASGDAYQSDAPASDTTATATASDLTPDVDTTIPTDPFRNVTRLPGYQDFGIDLMTPLNTGSISIGTGTSTDKVGLTAGDQLEFSWPSGSTGTIQATLVDDLGQTYKSTSAWSSGSPSDYFLAPRTGTYQINLDWSITTPTTETSTQVDYYLIPGPLNSLPELTTSYVDPTSPSTVIYGYSDPTMAQINPTLNQPGATGPANYFPYWSDQTYFPNKSDYTTTQLNDAYESLVANIPAGSGINDFGNIIGSNGVAPVSINNALNTAYSTAFSPVGGPAVSPPMPPTPYNFSSYPVPVDYFNLSTATTAQEAVYEFFYNTNLMRQAVSTTISGTGNSLESWIQGVINDLEGTAGAEPTDIADTISTGQTGQVQGVTVVQPSTTAARKPGKSILHGLLDAIGTAIEGAIVAAVGAADPFAGVGAQLGFDALNAALSGQSSSASNPNSSIYVPFTPLTNAILNYQSLTTIATDLTASVVQQWNSIRAGVMSNAYQDAIMSNFGLLAALIKIQGTPLGDPAVSSSDNAPDLTYASWETMTPATFQWQQIPATGFPTANGASASYVPQTLTLNGATGPWGVAAGDFANNGVPDIAVATGGSSTVNVFTGDSSTVPIYNQTVTYGTPTSYSLNGGTGAAGIAAGDFGNGSQDLIVSDRTSSTATLLLNNGNGGFTAGPQIGLDGGTGGYEIAVGDFNDDGKLDFAIACNKSSTLVVCINQGYDSATDTVNFTSYNLSLQGGTDPVDLAVDNVNGQIWPDIVVSDQGTSTLSVFTNTETGQGDCFNKAQTVDLSGLDQVGAIAVGDFNGNDDIALAAMYGDGSTPVPTSLGGNGKTSSGVALWYLQLNSSGVTPTPRLSGVLENTSEGATINSPTMGVAMTPIPRGTGDDGLAVAYEYFKSVPIAPNDFQTSNYQGYVSLVSSITSVSPYSLLFKNTTGSKSFATTSSSDNGVNFQPQGIAFAGNSIVYSNNKSSTIQVTSNGLVNALATFAPGQSAQTNLLNLSGSVDATSYLGSLQGGQATDLPTYYPNANPNVPGSPNLSTQVAIASPALFLSWTPATVSGDYGGSYQSQSGGIVTGWNLVDYNGNPIALGTAQQLFGTPAYSSQFPASTPALWPKLWPGTTVSPIDPSAPIVAYNGGWFYATKPLNNAPTTWADAFFLWGLQTPGFSPESLIPANAINQTVPGGSGSYSIDYSAAITSPQSSVDAALANSSISTAVSSRTTGTDATGAESAKHETTASRHSTARFVSRRPPARI